jgi:multidrug efflux pump subunit AcrB
VPYGGKVRVVNVDIDPDALYARGLSPQDVSNAILTQNIILPAGTSKIGTREYDVAVNSKPGDPERPEQDPHPLRERGHGERRGCRIRP